MNDLPVPGFNTPTSMIKTPHALTHTKEALSLMVTKTGDKDEAIALLLGMWPSSGIALGATGSVMFSGTLYTIIMASNPAIIILILPLALTMAWVAASYQSKRIKRALRKLEQSLNPEHKAKLQESLLYIEQECQKEKAITILYEDYKKGEYSFCARHYLGYSPEALMKIAAFLVNKANNVSDMKLAFYLYNSLHTNTPENIELHSLVTPPKEVVSKPIVRKY